MTRGTRDLLSLMLADSGHSHEMHAESSNVRHARRDKGPVAPSYIRGECGVG